MPEWSTPFEEIQIGKGKKLKSGDDLAILSFGPLGNYAMKASEQLELQGVSVAVYDMRFAKPLDEAILHEVFEKHQRVVTIEDGCLQGGFGSAVIEFMADNGYSSIIKRLGISDMIVEHGEPNELYRECGIDTAGIIKTVHEFLDTKLSAKAVALN